MVDLIVTFCEKLDCGKCDNVFLWVHNPYILAVNDGIVDQTKLISFLPGEITDVVIDAQCSYTYTITYDENDLLNPNSLLLPCDVRQICCANCVLDYIDERFSSLLYSRIEVAESGNTFVHTSGDGVVTNVDYDYDLTSEVNGFIQTITLTKPDGSIDAVNIAFLHAIYIDPLDANGLVLNDCVSFRPTLDGTTTLGTATFGWSEIHASDSTERFSVTFNATVPELLTTDALMRFGVAGSVELELSATELTPAVDAGLALGSALLGYSEIHASDSTERFSVTFNATVPELLTTDTLMRFGVGGAAELELTATELTPIADAGLALGSVALGYSDLHLSDGTDRWSVTAGVNNLLLSAGADDQRLQIAGGSAAVDSNGAFMVLYGVGHANAGDFEIQTGDVVGSNVIISLNATNSSFQIQDDAGGTTWIFQQDGDLEQGGGAGGNINFTKASTGINTTQSGFTIGTSGANSWGLKSSGLVRWSVESNGDFGQDVTNGGDITFNKASTGINIAATGYVLGAASSTMLVGMNTSDGSDDGILHLAASSVASTARGAHITLDGNEANTGRVYIRAGAVNSANASVNIMAGHNAGFVNIRNPADGIMWQYSWDGNFIQNATNGGDIVFAGSNPGTVRLGVENGLVATGSVQGDALVVTGHILTIGSGAADTGIILPVVDEGEVFYVYNFSGSDKKVYPASGGSIGAGTNGAKTIPNGNTLLIFTYSSGVGQSYILS